MNVDEVVTGIVVCHNTKELIARAFFSVRKYHPTMKIIIVDASDRKDPCYEYVLSLRGPRTQILHVDKNIGHGKGLCLGIVHVQTPYFLIFDSDIEMFKSPISGMLQMMESNTWGVGYLEKIDIGGHEWGSRPEKMKLGPMKYMHPYFCLIQHKEYKKYSPFIHHGAPAVQIMLDIHRMGLSDIVLKEFPGLGHTSSSGWTWKGSPKEYIRHDTRGTRDVMIKKKRIEIEGTWDKIKEPKIEIPSSGVCAITCTGDRPIAFYLCSKWIINQKVQPQEWIIIDDGKNPIENVPKMSYVKYIRREPQPGDPKHTMILNLKEAVKHITANKICIMEDDEYYAPEYIQEMSKRLDSYEVVGIGRSKYYYLPKNTFHQHANMGHASLAQTAFRKSFLKEMINLLNGDSFLDIRIWSLINPGKVSLSETGLQEYVSQNGRGFIFNDNSKSLYVGMKGLPGRFGIGSGHRGIGNRDVNLSVLGKWVTKSNDLKTYMNVMSWKEIPKEIIEEQQKIVIPPQPTVPHIPPQPILKGKMSVPTTVKTNTTPTVLRRTQIGPMHRGVLRPNIRPQ